MEVNRTWKFLFLREQAIPGSIKNPLHVPRGGIIWPSSVVDKYCYVGDPKKKGVKQKWQP